MLKLIRRLIEKPPIDLRVSQPIAEKAEEVVESSLRALSRSRKAQVAPAVLLVTGAGVAVWWWTQWARGRAESEAAKDGDAKP